MSIETDARQTAEEYTRRHIGGMQPVETVGDKVRAAFEAGAVWAREQDTREPSTDTGCPHEACEIDTAGNPTRCADCGDYLDSVPDREPSDAEVTAFREAWKQADAEGDSGNRVRRGLIAAQQVRNRG